VDEAQLNVRGGDGGAGCMSFRREAHVPRGGPDGGDGGSGGSVWIEATRNMASLLAFRDHPHRRATSGTHGQGQKRHGKAADDLVVEVPEGTVVRDHEGNIVADLVGHGDRYLAARGGRGGRGNARFLSNRRRAPHFAEQGEYGEEHWLRLELKLMADAALVGFPNAGKSTLISAISAARPKIADYPFTTLEPHLGVVHYRDHEFVVADIPGLIEGAADGRGLGHRFLRHIERARVLVLLLDLAATDGRTPAEQLEVLLHELSAYRPQLLDRPRVVVLSKCDVAGPDVAAAALAALDRDGASSDAGIDAIDIDDSAVDSVKVRAISAVTHVGLDEMLGDLAQLVERARVEPHVDAPVATTVLRPLEEGVVVVREGERAWRVQGRAAERAVAVSDLTEPDAIQFVQDRLRRLGVDRALVRAAVGEGDTVRIAELEFEYHGDLM
jgi:GTP-binding protein